jgi:hypothetical protein
MSKAKDNGNIRASMDKKNKPILGNGRFMIME